ncbi:MAG: TonB-dependent receptor [Bacteroidales bacterium]|nr:TonB-dependent receptor [Bacteroidales bacterium]
MNNNSLKSIFMRVKIKYLSIAVMLFIANCVFAQEDEGNLGQQTVIIYNEYTPVLKDASRIQFLPVIIDTIKVKPVFEYSTSPTTVYKTDYTPTSIVAASLKGEPLQRLDNGMIKLGMGNYLSPFVEVYYNSRREKNFSVGAFAKHQSSFGKIKNSAGQKIFSGYNDNIIKTYGKKFLRNSTLSGDIGFSSNQIYFYGYNPDIIIPFTVEKPRDRNEMEMQRYNRLNAKVGIVSTNTAQNRIDYNFDLAYQYFFTASDDSQHKIKFDAGLSKLIKANRFGLDAGVVFNNNVFDNVGFTSINMKYNEVFLTADPYFKHYTENWQIKLGAKTTGEFIDGVNDYHIYPDIQFQHNISNTIIPYAGFSGYIENNNFEHLSFVNPFINRNNNFQVTNYAQIIDVGLKGNISKNLYFHINGNYSKIDNMGFFVNDTTLDLENKFVLEYTNIERFSGYGEFALRNVGKFSGILKGHYYYYSYIKSREKAWHMPTFDVYLRANYQFDEKLSFGVETGVLSTRYAKNMDNPTSGGHKLKPIIDLNIYADYCFASNFNAFIYLNNLTAQKQYYWNNYQSQGFNVMLGLKYMF